MTTSLLYLLGFSLVALLCTLYVVCWAFNHRLVIFAIGYTATACIVLALVVFSVVCIFSDHASLEPAINALACLVAGTLPLLQVTLSIHRFGNSFAD